LFLLLKVSVIRSERVPRRPSAWGGESKDLLLHFPLSKRSTHNLNRRSQGYSLLFEVIANYNDRAEYDRDN